MKSQGPRPVRFLHPRAERVRLPRKHYLAGAPQCAVSGGARPRLGNGREDRSRTERYEAFEPHGISTSSCKCSQQGKTPVSTMPLVIPRQFVGKRDMDRSRAQERYRRWMMVRDENNCAVHAV